MKNSLKIKNFKKTKKIIEIVQEKITNDELRDYIINKLKYFNNSMGIKFTNSDDNTLSIDYKRTGDSLSITFDPDMDNFSTIKIECSYWGKKRKELKCITFEDDTIIISEETLGNNVYYNSNKLCEIELQKNIRKYVNDLLVYKYDYCSSIDNNIGSDRASTSIEETFIQDDGVAVKRVNQIALKNAFLGPQNDIEYSATDHYNEPYFNSRKNTKKVYIYGMHQISEEEYNEFIRNMNIKKITKVKI